MKIFFSGIGGSGMSAIAAFMAEQGHIITGSDRLFDREPEHRTCLNLKANGINIVPQDGMGLNAGFDLAVFSTAVEKNNPDSEAAANLSIPVKTRPEFLADIVSRCRTVAVAGTSGKSTVSGMLAFVMEGLGLDPGFIGGGRVKQFRSSRNQGNYRAGAADTLVIEACESDGSIVLYRPEHSLILNLALDHHSVKETASMFEQLSDNTPGTVITCADDANLAACRLVTTASFSIDRASEYRAEDIQYHRFSGAFTVNSQRYTVSLPGRHNVYNALACISLLSELGADPARVAAVLPAFTGIERRFDVHLDSGTRLVIDDYAHNPHKIAYLLETMQGMCRKVCYIFQPHGFGPTRLMKDEYIRTFAHGLRDSDQLLLLPVYYAGGTAAKDISSRDLAEGVMAAGKHVALLSERAEFFSLSLDFEGFAVFGARDDSLADFASEIAARLRN